VDVAAQRRERAARRQPLIRRLWALGALALCAGCGGGGHAAVTDGGPVTGPPIVTRPIGVGPGFRLSALGGLRCSRGAGAPPIVAHLELFARRETLIIPPGIGVVPGRCRYPLRTHDPTGLIDADRAGLTIRELFAVWGQPFGPRRIAGFRGTVLAFVDGHRVRRNIGDISVRHHAQIVLEIAGYVPPHARYTFPRPT
jgi:hypothetical protein